MERHKTLGDYSKPAPKRRVGADIDAWCTRCKMVLTHTIMAMTTGDPAKVRCNTCGSEHRFRPDPPGTTKPSKKTRPSGTWAPAPPKRPEKAWLEASAGKDVRNPIAYHPKTTYELEQVIMHGRFGLGVIMGFKEGGKIIVVFEDETRILVHGRG